MIDVSEPTVLHEDEELVVVDKPAGMATAAGGGIDDDASLHAWVTRHVGARTYIVHRLDRGTSGVIVFAKSADAHRRLSQAFESREVAEALLGGGGRPPAARDRRDHRAAARPSAPGVSAWSRKGSEALTRYRRLERLQDADLLEVEPLTGRRHQIRVHCYAIGHPVLGDTRYGSGPAGGRGAAPDAARRRAAVAGD